MCDFPGKLIAWLDDELAEGEAAEVRRHLQGCMECRSRIKAYEQVNEDVIAYCNEASSAKENRGTSGWTLASAAALVAAIGLLLAFPRARVEETSAHQAMPSFPDAAAIASPAVTFERVGAPTRRMHRSRRIAPAQTMQVANWAPAEPGIQIAIPAEAMFPPGAVPEGIDFVAEVSIAPDGSAQGLRLQPRLFSFERRSTQP